MSATDATEAPDLPWSTSRSQAGRRAPHLVLAWSFDDHERLGEVVPVRAPSCLGRGAAREDDPFPRVMLHRVRPGRSAEGAPLASGRISRVQLLLTPIDESSLRVRSVGRTVVRVNGVSISEGAAASSGVTLRVGDVLEIQNAAIFLLTSRPLDPPAAPGLRTDFPFGAADPFGLVGESEPAWKLREQLAFAAATAHHVLVLGESGAGKELAARTIHGMSDRADRTFVARNATTMPEALIDAELFGNLKNYPNPGMPERPGLIGEADGSTLLLDEIGDLPEKSQVHLLRVLDQHGEYQRLGDTRTSRSTFRLVAATNRAPDTLKHDFLARFIHRIALPGLPERRDDIPLVIEEILRRIIQKTPAVAQRFFEPREGKPPVPRIAPDLLIRLVRHPYTHHVRELDRLLWLAIGTAQGDFLGITPAVEAELKDSVDAVSDPTELDRDTLEQALNANGRSPTRTAKALGLKNRFVLLRLLKKHSLSATSEDTSE